MKLLQAYRGGFEGRPGWWLALAYDEDNIERLKQRVPASLRTWDEEGKRWWIADSAVERALKVVPSLEAYLKQGTLL